MGYTHYFTFNKPAKGSAKKAEKLYQLAVKDCAKIIKAYSIANGGLAGYTAHTAIGEYGGIEVNGSRENGCEPFILQEHYRDNLGFNCCKTRQLPYDVVVVACLTALKDRLGDLVQIASDGSSSAWDDGLKLAKRVLKRKKLTIPLTIEGEIYDVVKDLKKIA